MKSSLNPPNHFNRLPIDLFVPIIFLSFDTPDRIQRLIRTEELRLVNRAWQTAIDSTAIFWACIPNEPSPDSKSIPRWIIKSGEAPLHILSKQRLRPLGGFMPLVIPHAHRWRTVELAAYSSCISDYIKKPVPLLEAFHVSNASILRDTIVFGGVHPALSTVGLYEVVLPNDTGFLRNLKVLRLRSVSRPSGRLRLSQLQTILDSSPHLEQLVLDARYTVDMEPPPPILLASLASFQLTATMYRPHCPASISMMIQAPNVTHLDLCFDDHPVPATLTFFSELTVERIRRALSLEIKIFPWVFKLSTDIQPKAPRAPQGVLVSLSEHPQEVEVAVRLLRYLGTITSPSVPVDLVVHQNTVEGVFDYLKSSREAEVGYPLPELRSIQLYSEHGDGYPYERIVGGLARAGRDLTNVTFHIGKSESDGGEGQVLKWNAEAMSLVMSD
ncbi:hypothetical protein FS837_004187 [Tulasnella sp. UAMH 9824]|nr:hypothetical protein FS837_004187 [Tulasnella sp. UAMH 9824]